MKGFFVAIALSVSMIFFLCVAPLAMAHGTDHQVIKDNKTVVVAFSYDDGEPMRYAEVLVFGPENDEFEYQNGRTDQNGHFAFCPNAPGLWRIKAGDGMGHMEQGQIEVRDAKPDENAPAPEVIDKNKTSGSDSKTLKVVAGISLIGNLCMGLLLWKRRPQ